MCKINFRMSLPFSSVRQIPVPPAIASHRLLLDFILWEIRWRRKPATSAVCNRNKWKFFSLFSPPFLVGFVLLEAFREYWMNFSERTINWKTMNANCNKCLSGYSQAIKLLANFDKINSKSNRSISVCCNKTEKRYGTKDFPFTTDISLFVPERQWVTR